MTCRLKFFDAQRFTYADGIENQQSNNLKAETKVLLYKTENKEQLPMNITKQAFHKIYQDIEYHLNDGHPLWSKDTFCNYIIAC